MVKIVENIFKEEIDNPSLPITKMKIERSQEAMVAKGFEVTYSAIKAKVNRLRKMNNK